MGSLNKLLRNSIFAIFTSIAIRAVNVILFILIARWGGPKAAGIFTLGITYLIIFSVTTWGLDEYLVRQVVSQRQKAGQYFGTFLLLRIVLIALSYLVFYFVVMAMDYPESTSLPILIIGLAIFPENIGNVGQAVLSGHERFQIPLVAGILSGLSKLVVSLVALSEGAGLVGVGWAWVIGCTIGACVSLATAYRLIAPVDRSEWFIPEFWKINLLQLPPFFIFVFMITLEYQLDIILLSAFQGEVQVGWYGAVTTIIAALVLPAQGFRVAVYPVMTRYKQDAPKELRSLYLVSMYYLSVISIPLAAGLAIISPGLIKLIYGPDFFGAVLPLQIISAYLIFNYLSVPNTRMLLVHNRQTRLVWFLLGSLVMNILLNLLLDPILGAVGAAIARLCSVLVFFTPMYIYVTRNLQPNRILSFLSKPLAATIPMSLGAYFAYQINMWLAIIVGCVIYVGFMLLMRGLKSPMNVMEELSI